MHTEGLLHTRNESSNSKGNGQHQQGDVSQARPIRSNVREGILTG